MQCHTTIAGPANRTNTPQITPSLDAQNPGEEFWASTQKCGDFDLLSRAQPTKPMNFSQFSLTRFTCQPADQLLRSVIRVSAGRASRSINCREHFANRTAQANLGKGI